MFGISIPELLLVFAVILIIFGPKRLPELAKTFGKFFGKARHESDKLKREFYNTIYPPMDFSNKPQISNKPETSQNSGVSSEESNEENSFEEVSIESIEEIKINESVKNTK